MCRTRPRKISAELGEFLGPGGNFPQWKRRKLLCISFNGDIDVLQFFYVWNSHLFFFHARDRRTSSRLAATSSCCLCVDGVTQTPAAPRTDLVSLVAFNHRTLNELSLINWKTVLLPEPYTLRLRSTLFIEALKRRGQFARRVDRYLLQRQVYCVYYFMFCL